MSNQVYISQDANQVNLVNTDKQLIITEIGSDTSVNVTQPLTSIIEVSTPGPKGDTGLTGPTGPTGPMPETGSFATTGSNVFIGDQTITGSFNVTAGITGSLFGTATTASYYNTSNLATTASNNFNGSQVFTGSIQGNVSALTVASNTASINLATGNFFTLQLVSGSNIFINPSNITPGQTATILVSTTGSGTVSFPSTVKQPSGSSYTPTTSTSKDVLTFLSYDTTTLYVASVKNLI